MDNSKSLIDLHIRGKESDYIEMYIQYGPAKVKENFEFSDEEWGTVFNYLVFEHNLLYKTIVANSEFFVDMYVKYGSAHVREVLDILPDKYNEIWNQLFDFIAISHDGLIYHVMEHRDKYTLALKARGSGFVRKVLGIWDRKYEENWAKVLDFLLHAVCDAIFSETTFENAMKAFSLIMNGVREHRPIFKSGLII